jgi:hypothetical protein
MTRPEVNSSTLSAYLLGVPLAAHVERQWPQMTPTTSGRH